MGLALYRKYRPGVFADVIGQEHVTETLKNELASGAVAHAYLFTGPRGVGKTTCARIFAKAANCLDRKGGESEPCNSCAACTEQNTGRSLDVIEIDAASNTGVDNVRDNIIEHVRFAPTSRKYKVFIIDEVHMLSASAWNALLKTLEEPPAHALFIMATTETHKVPATILSRCQRFDFKRIPKKEMVERLERLVKEEGVKVSADVLELVAKRSDGCLRDAESLLEQVLSLDEKKITMEEASIVLPRSSSEEVKTFMDALFGGQVETAIKLITTLVEDGVDLQQFTAEGIEYLRELLIEQLSKNQSAQKTTRALELMLAARFELKSTPIPQLPLEMVAARFADDAGGSPLVKQATPPPEKRPKEPEVLQKSEGPSAVVATSHRPQVEEKKSEPGPESVISNQQSVVATDVALPPIDTVALRWDELCIAVQEENPSLPFLLRVARPIRFDGGTLIVGVQYPMHAKKLNEDKHRKSMEAGLTQLYGNASMLTRAEVVAASGSAAAAPTDSFTSNILEQFGGSVVE